MTKTCTLKESFIEKMLDKYQPKWRKGEDISAETKQKIREYVASKMPKDIKEDAECITDYSIYHMAKRIREREGLPDPVHTNKGKACKCKPEKVSESKPSDEDSEFAWLIANIQKLIKKSGIEKVREALQQIEKEANVEFTDTRNQHT